MPGVRKRCPFHYRDLISNSEFFSRTATPCLTICLSQLLCSLTPCHLSKAETLLYYLAIRKLLILIAVPWRKPATKEHANSWLVAYAVSLPGLQAEDLATMYSCYDKRNTYCILGNCMGMKYENSSRTWAFAQNPLKEIICTIVKVVSRR